MLKELAGFLGTGILRAAIADADAIDPLGAVFALLPAVNIGHTVLQALCENPAPADQAFSLFASGLDAAFDEVFAYGLAFSMALLVRRVADAIVRACDRDGANPESNQAEGVLFHCGTPL
jgi:hypothetical protein